MKALKFNKTGSLEELKIVTVADPIAKAGEVIVQIHAAAINPSDVKNVLGKMSETRVPRIPGRDFAGIVISDSKWKGKSVFGTGGTLGFSKDGTHAEYVAVSEDALVELPENLSFSAATAMSLSYVTAWQAVANDGHLKAQETVLITGASGTVGDAAVRIAKHLGATVIATVASHPLAPDIAKTIQSISLNKENLVDAVNKLTTGRGVNLIIDVVGGPLFEPCLRCLSQYGRQIVIASTGNPQVSFNLLDFYHKQAHLIGVDTLKMSSETCASILKTLSPGMQNRTFIPLEIDEISLTEAPKAYEEILKGNAKTKKVIVFPKQ